MVQPVLVPFPAVAQPEPWGPQGRVGWRGRSAVLWRWRAVCAVRSLRGRPLCAPCAPVPLLPPRRDPPRAAVPAGAGFLPPWPCSQRRQGSAAVPPATALGAYPQLLALPAAGSLARPRGLGWDVRAARPH